MVPHRLAGQAGILTLALLAIVVILILIMRYVFYWDVTLIASVWVAIGTLALAAVTWWNVNQTKSVISNEDRRHQQLFVPIVELFAFDVSDVPLGYLHIHAKNIGKGPALDVKARMSGSVKISYQVYEEGRWQEKLEDCGLGNLAFEKSAAPASADSGSDAWATLTARDDNLRRHTPNPATPTIKLAEIVVSSAKVTYTDIFGNDYETIYDDFSARKYHLKQPENLNRR